MRLRALRIGTICLVAATLALTAAAAGVEVGQKAPDFKLQDQHGNTVALSDFAGKVRVLEWTNPDCPFVQRHYRAGTMKKLAARLADEGVVWLTVNSTHYMDRAADAKFAAAHGLAVPVLDDHEGTVGRLYGATTTPDMFVIDADGTVVYSGAIDDDPRGAKEHATNYVAEAVAATLAGTPVATAETQSYGCSVKYAK